MPLFARGRSTPERISFTKPAFFQGVLGHRKVLALLEEGCEEFSNRAGVQYVSFAKGNVKEVFGEVLATLRREFGQ
jgi:hypothetical protein